MSLTATSPAPSEVCAPDLSPVARFDAQQRQKAREDGEPTDRTRSAGYPPSESEATAFCWVDRATQRVVHALDDFDVAAPSPVNVPVLADLFDRDFTLVVPDPATAQRLIRATASSLAAGRCDPDVGNAVRRRLDITTRLSASSRLVVVTRALARRYWMPSNLADDDPLAWARAFGLSAGRGVTQRLLLQLTRRAGDGAIEQNAITAGKAERDALSAARYPGLKMAVASYRAVERAETALSAWARLDDLLLARNVLTGDVCRLDVRSVGEEGFTAVASQPFTMRVGKGHLLMSKETLRARAAGRGQAGEGRLSHITLETVRVEGEQVVVEVRTQTKSMPQSGLVRRTTHPAHHRAAQAAASGQPLFLTEEPFLGHRASSEPSTGRWTAPQRPEPVAGRWDMPLDVAFAGSPNAGR